MSKKVPIHNLEYFFLGEKCSCNFGDWSQSEHFHRTFRVQRKEILLEKLKKYTTTERLCSQCASWATWSRLFERNLNDVIYNRLFAVNSQHFSAAKYDWWRCESIYAVKRFWDWKSYTSVFYKLMKSAKTKNHLLHVETLIAQKMCQKT